MQAIEFETDIQGGFIKIPHAVQLNAQHVKVIVLYQESQPDASERSKSTTLPAIFYTPLIRASYEPFERDMIYEP